MLMWLDLMFFFFCYEDNKFVLGFLRINCFVFRFFVFSKFGDNSRDRFGIVLVCGDSRVWGFGGFGYL